MVAGVHRRLEPDARFVIAGLNGWSARRTSACASRWSPTTSHATSWWRPWASRAPPRTAPACAARWPARACSQRSASGRPTSRCRASMRWPAVHAGHPRGRRPGRSRPMRRKPASSGRRPGAISGRPRLRVVEAAAARRHVLAFLVNMTAYPNQRPAALRRQGHLSHRPDRARLPGRQLRLRRLAGLRGREHARQRQAGSHDDRLRARLVYDAAGVRADAGPSAASSCSLLAGFVQSLCMVTLAVLLLRDTSEKFRGRVMGVRMLGGHLQPAAGPAGRRRPDRPHRLSRDGNALSRRRPACSRCS